MLVTCLNGSVNLAPPWYSNYLEWVKLQGCWLLLLLKLVWIINSFSRQPRRIWRATWNTWMDAMLLTCGVAELLLHWPSALKQPASQVFTRLHSLRSKVWVFDVIQLPTCLHAAAKQYSSGTLLIPLACPWMQQVDPEVWRLRRVSIQATVLLATEQGWWRRVLVHTVNYKLKQAFSQLPFPTVFHFLFYWLTYNFHVQGSTSRWCSKTSRHFSCGCRTDMNSNGGVVMSCERSAC